MVLGFALSSPPNRCTATKNAFSLLQKTHLRHTA